MRRLDRMQMVSSFSSGLKRNFGISVEEKIVTKIRILKRKFQNIDLGVFDIAEFEFLGLESKFERN